MIRRQLSLAAATTSRCARTTLAVIPTATSQRLMNSSTSSSNNATSNNNNNESEAEREARMRQEMMNRMMGGRNPFAGMFGQTQSGQQAAAGGASGGQSPPPLRGFDTSNYNHWANSPFHRSLRFWCSVLVFITGIYMMRRMGIMGDYSHLTLPFYAASPADQTKWILFIFNVQDSRRRQLVSEWESKKLQFPNMNFFDYVDSQEQNWRSSPNFSGEQVIAAVGGAMRTQGPPRAITSIKATLNTSNFFSSTIFGGTGNPAEERAKRIDGMMTTLGTALSPMASVMGGLSQQPLPPQLQQYMQQQQGGQPQQQQGGNNMYSSGGLTAIPTGSVSYDRQQQYGGMSMPTSQLQQQSYNQQHQQGYPSSSSSNFNSNNSNNLSYASRPDSHSYYGTGNQGVVANLSQYTNSSNSSQQQQQNTTSDNNSSSASNNNGGKESHQCEVKFLNDDQSSANNQQRPSSAPAGAAESADK